MSTSSHDLRGGPMFLSLSDYMHLDPFATHSKQKEDNLTSNSMELPFHIANMCTSAMEDATDQLKILGSGLFPVTNICIGNIEQRAKKFYTADPVFDPYSGDTFEENFNKKKLMKLYYDSSKIGQLLTQIKNELRYNRDYSTLTNYTEFIVNAEKEDKQLFANEVENMAVMDRLKQTLNNEQKDSKKKIHEMNKKISILKDEREDVLYVNLIRKRYIEAWENARVSQTEYTYKLLENKLENTINENKNEIEKEERVNSEIKYYIKENIKDMTDAIDYWTARYDKDSETRRLETQVYKNKRIELSKEYAALQEIYNLHDKQINDYLEFKEMKRIEAELLAFKIAKVTKLQAWWRGIMVRRKLGRFDPDYMEKQMARNALAKSKKNKGKKGKKY